MYVHKDKCLHLGLDPKRVASIARRISRAAEEAHAMGLTVFGTGAGGGVLKGWTEDGRDFFFIAELDGDFDGGDPSGTGLRASELDPDHPDCVASRRLVY